jgi:2-oxoglutarate ferredoxin oxidoreductase subunit delta
MPNKIKLEKEYCKGCGFCIEVCPKNILTRNNDVNSRGYTVPKVINEEECIACKKCELVCPEMAISILKEEITKDERN